MINTFVYLPSIESVLRETVLDRSRFGLISSNYVIKYVEWRLTEWHVLHSSFLERNVKQLSFSNML